MEKNPRSFILDSRPCCFSQQKKKLACPTKAHQNSIYNSGDPAVFTRVLVHAYDFVKIHVQNNKHSYDALKRKQKAKEQWA